MAICFHPPTQFKHYCVAYRLYYITDLLSVDAIKLSIAAYRLWVILQYMYMRKLFACTQLYIFGGHASSLRL